MGNNFVRLKFEQNKKDEEQLILLKINYINVWFRAHPQKRLNSNFAK